MRAVPPIMMCRKHINTEHGEIHKFLPTFRKGHSVRGRFYPEVQIQLIGMKERHDALAAEWVRRGYNHNSPIENLDWLEQMYPAYYHITIDPVQSIRELAAICPDCEERIRQEDSIHGLRLPEFQNQESMQEGITLW